MSLGVSGNPTEDGYRATEIDNAIYGTNGEVKIRTTMSLPGFHVDT